VRVYGVRQSMGGAGDVVTWKGASSRQTGRYEEACTHSMFVDDTGVMIIRALLQVSCPMQYCSRISNKTLGSAQVS
jgi:hypothetical protein